jgi:protein phosphatase
MIVEGAGRSDRGRIRPHNEDSLLVSTEDGLFAVADGMGGHNAGEVASRLAIEAVGEVLAFARRGETPVEALLRRTVEEANRRISEKAGANLDYEGMGTTLIVGVIDDGRLWIAHVGDSRAYLLRDGQLRQMTTDHSLVNELVRLGIISRDSAASDKRRNVVTRALGSGMTVTPDLIEQKLEPGDVVLLCTDGLNTMVPDESIAATIVRTGKDPQKICEELVAAANAAGGEDNVTVVVAVPTFRQSESVDDPAGPPTDLLDTVP